MVLAVALDEVHQNRKRDPSGYTQTRFFGSRDNPELPLANYNEQVPGYFSSTHFHVVDQFQVVLDGKGTIGRHHLAPYCIHFSRAYTPYGPLIADRDTGLKFFVLRPRPDTGSMRVPDEQELLDRVPNREPWQVTRQVAFPPAASGAAIAETLLQPVPGIEDDGGLAAYTLCMKPNAQVQAPDPSHCDGQYLVVLKGSLLHEGKEYPAPALLFVWPEEGPISIRAGAQGLDAMVLDFPRRRTQAEHALPTVQAAAGLKKWQCELCAFCYDEALGMPEEGIAPGTRWQDVPDTWSCPDCSASKADFQMIEI